MKLYAPAFFLGRCFGGLGEAEEDERVVAGGVAYICKAVAALRYDGCAARGFA